MGAKAAKALLRLVGIRTILKMGWKHLIYPNLKNCVENNDIDDWDEKTLDALNKNIDKIIDLI